MNQFFHYSLSFDGKIFAAFFSTFPALYEDIRNIDKLTWSKFDVSFVGKTTIGWVQKKKMSQITSNILSSFCSDFKQQDFFLIPSKKQEIDIDFASNEANFLINFAQKMKENSINLLEIYKMPEHPNEFVADGQNHHSQQTYDDFSNLCLLKEVPQSINLNTVFSKEGYQFDQESVFPIHPEHDFSLLKFISYFRYLIFRIPNLLQLLKSFSLDNSYFPFLVEAFTLEFIPSFSHHHNTYEKLGDAILGLCIVTDVIKALPDQPLYYINHKYNKSISNSLFNAIGAQYHFDKCVIGPIDEEKVPADCFEALAGVLFYNKGYSEINSFWQQRIFDIDDSFLNANQLTKTIKSMRLNLRNAVTDIKPSTNIPPYAQQFVGNLNFPAHDAFTNKTEIQQKCKMIGASFLKAIVALCVFTKRRKDEDMLIIEQKVKKNSLEEISQKIGFPNARQLKIFIGGLFLTNDYEQVKNLIIEQFIPYFELLPRRRRHHRRHQTEE